MKSTLLALTKQLEDKVVLMNKANQLANSTKNKDMKIIEILDTSNLVSSLIFKTDISMDITPYNSIASSEHLALMPPKVLRKMQYTMNQISGEIYSKMVALKVSLREDLAQGL